MQGQMLVCEECGSVVEDTELHLAWHKRINDNIRKLAKEALNSLAHQEVVSRKLFRA